MKIAAVIAEYNPFHNGHLYLAEQIRKETKADYIIAVMSGDFTQRGLPAMADKFTRAAAAAACGIDAIFELPVLYATASAERFSIGAVSLLDSLGCIDFLCFGSESGDLANLHSAAEVLAAESQELQTLIQTQLKLGLSYPNAIAVSLKKLDGAHPELPPELLDTPNNVLAVEYLKALKRLSSDIQPVTVRRIGTEYHDAHHVLDKKTRRMYASAGAVRSIFSSKVGSIVHAAPLIPPPVYRLLSSRYGRMLPVELDDFSLLLSYRVLSETAASLTDYLDVSRELANRLIRTKTDCLLFTETIKELKSKKYTFARINRALLHLVLGITEEYLPFFAQPVPYARLLALRKGSSPLLKTVKQRSRIPLITKAADRRLSPEADRLFQLDADSANLYGKVVSQKYQTAFLDDIRHSAEIIVS